MAHAKPWRKWAPDPLASDSTGFFPRWLAWPLFAAGAGYVLNSLGGLVLPPSLRWTTAKLQILGVGEVPFFTFYLLIWGIRGYAVDRIAALMVLVLFAAGVAGFVLLFGNRIDPIQYAVLKLASLVLVIGLVVRWPWSESSESRATTRAAGASA